MASTGNAWKDLILEAKADLKAAALDDYESYSGEDNAIYEIADSSVPTYEWDTNEVIRDGNLMREKIGHLEIAPDATLIDMANLLIYELLKEELYNYASELTDELVMCVHGEKHDPSEDEMTDCKSCGDPFCQAHGGTCADCGRGICENCGIKHGDGLWICDDANECAEARGEEPEPEPDMSGNPLKDVLNGTADAE